MFVVIAFAVLMVIARGVVAPLGMIGGFLLGAANAFLIGATLSLTEQAVLGSRPLQWADIPRSAGQYFWEVISVGFMVWFPLLILQMALQANPYQSVLTTAVFFLVFVLLNPVPEIIYQGRQSSATEVLRESYEFVLENWIEWFLPVAILFAPFGFSFFLKVISFMGITGVYEPLIDIPIQVLERHGCTLPHPIPHGKRNRFSWFNDHQDHILVTFLK